MSRMTLTQIEATGIQEYIFASNNVRQNAGASELVARSTTEWLPWALSAAGLTNNAVWDEDAQELVLRDVEQDEVQAEVIYFGGGNALLLFDGEPEDGAIRFTQIITRQVLEDARGLSLVVEHLPFDWKKDPMGGEGGKHFALRRLMFDNKLSRPLSVPLAGLGVTAACVFTGQPVVDREARGRLESEPNTVLPEAELRPVSQTVRCKLQAANLARKRLGRWFLHDQLGAEEYKGGFLDNFDRLGDKGESSYLAVVHADGNDMGERFAAIAREYPKPDQNRAYLRRLRQFSQAVIAQSNSAMRETIRRLVQSRDATGLFGGVVPVPRNDDGKKCLPFRPIVFGGDDVTFVCEGRLGLTLAAAYLEAVGRGNLPAASGGEPGEPLYSRAGVAVVKTHYPFSRAYELAEDLCRSARKQLKERFNGKGCVIDWHISSSGVILPLEQVRGREYTSAEGNTLLMRPVRLNLGEEQPAGSQYWRSWETFQDVLGKFRDTEGIWAGRKNKLQALQNALRQGPDAVKQVRSNLDIPTLPGIPGQSTMPATGWQAGDCGYFDAIEALDLYVPLGDTRKESGE